MGFRTVALASLLALGIAGCAASPETIQPAYASPMTYRNRTCEELNDEGRRLHAAYAAAAEQQEQAQVGDAIGLVLIGLPVVSMTGENATPEIRRIKGEHVALLQVAVERGCTGRPAKP